MGYIKRYDPGTLNGAARMQAMQDVRLVRIHNVAGDIATQQTLYALMTCDDVPQAANDEG